MRSNAHGGAVMLARDMAGRRRLADEIVAGLADYGIGAVFAVAADPVNAVVDAIRRDGRLSLVGARHGAAAAIMAATCGKISGRPGVCLAEEGPGAAHLILGTHAAMADRAPLLALSGSSPDPQPLDPIALFSGSTVFNARVSSAAQVDLVGRALAESVVRAGPAHLACSSEFLTATPIPRSSWRTPGAGAAVDKALVADAATVLSNGQVAVVIGDVRHDVADEVTALADRVGAPVLVLPEGYRYPYEALRVTSAARGEATRVLDRAKRVLLVGPRTAAVRRLLGGRSVVQVVGAEEFGDQQGSGWLRLAGDPRDSLRQLIPLLPRGDRPPEWVDAAEVDPELWSAMDAALPNDAVVTLDPGRVLDGALGGFTARNRFLTSSFGLAVPGFAVPAGIGAVVARPRGRVVAVTTESGLADFAGELLTVGGHRFDLTVICLRTGDGELDPLAAAEAAGLAAVPVAGPEGLAAALLTPGPALVSVPVAARESPSRVHDGLSNIAEALSARGVRRGYSRSDDACASLCSGGVEPNRVHNAESAALTASAVAKFTGEPTMCVATTEADLLRQLNGVCDAGFDHVPQVLVGVRDETWSIDFTRLFSSVTLVASGAGADAVRVIDDALRARSPVYLEIDGEVDRAWRPPPAAPPVDVTPPADLLDRVARRLTNARRAVILAGRDARHARQDLEELAILLQAAVVSTRDGRCTVPDSHPHFIGTAAHGSARKAMRESDVVLALGFPRPEDACAGEAGNHVVVVHSDRTRLARAPGAGTLVHGSLRPVVQGLVERINSSGAGRAQAYWERASFRNDRKRAFEAELRSPAPGTRPGGLSPSLVARDLARLDRLPAAAVDVGLVTEWMDRHAIGLSDAVWSESFATMGFALPAAIGIAPLMPGRRVIAAIGDGGLGATLSELATLAKVDERVVVVVFDNRALGSVALDQRSHGWPRYGVGLHNGDLAAMAAAFGVPSVRAETRDDLHRALLRANDRPGPLLIDAVCDDRERPTPARPNIGHLVALARELRRRSPVVR